MANYNDDIKSAQADIKEAGVAVTWRKLARTANNTQPWKGSATPTDFPNIYLLYLGKASFTDGLFHLIKDTDVTDGAPDAIVAGGLPFTPELTDVIVTSDGIIAISNIDNLAPDGTPILWYLRFQ